MTQSLAAKSRVGFGLLLSAALVAACGSSASSTQPSAAASAAEPSTAASEAANLVIGYATKSATNQGWIIINKGAQDAADKAGVKLVILGPPTANEISGQLSVTEDLINQGVNALIIAPVDSTGIVPAVEKANAANIPVIALDTAIEGGKVASFVATDNVAAAGVQGEWTCTATGGKGTVILVNGAQASSTGRDRRQGFVDAMAAKCPDVKIIEVQTNWDQAEAQAGIESALGANADVVAIANAWDGATVAAVQALGTAGRTDIKVVGFDADPNALKAMLEGKVAADVAQLLYKMGYTAVETAITAAQGGTVEERIDTGSFLVTPDNAEQFARDNFIPLE